MMPAAADVSFEKADGWNSFFDGLKLDDCPYSPSDQRGNQRRIDWMIGWLDARTHKKYELRQRVKF